MAAITQYGPVCVGGANEGVVPHGKGLCVCLVVLSVGFDDPASPHSLGLSQVKVRSRRLGGKRLIPEPCVCRVPFPACGARGASERLRNPGEGASWMGPPSLFYRSGKTSWPLPPHIVRVLSQCFLQATDIWKKELTW